MTRARSGLAAHGAEGATVLQEAGDDSTEELVSALALEGSKVLSSCVQLGLLAAYAQC